MIARIRTIRPLYVVLSALSALAFAAFAAFGLGVAVGASFAVLALAVHAWAFAARQEVRVEDGRLVIRDGVGPLAWTRRYEAGEIGDLRVDPAAQETIRFDYRGKTHGFAATLDPSEAERIAARVREALR